MSASIPKNLQMMVSRLSNMERTTVRVRPQSNDSVGSGQTVSFRLPTNTMIDLHNLQIKGVHTFEGTGMGVGMPTFMKDAVERIEIIVNGQLISGNNHDYGSMSSLLRAHERDSLRYTAAHYLESGDAKGEMPKSTAGVAAGNHLNSHILRVDQESSPVDFGADNTPLQKFPFVMNRLGGFLGGKYVRFIDTAILGPVEVRLRLHSGSVAYAGQESTTDPYGRVTTGYYTGKTAPDFTWSELYMFMDTISFADDFYRAILANRLSQQNGTITIPYENSHSFQKGMKSNSDTMTFNLGTQSLNMLLGTLRNDKYNSRTVKKYSPQALNSNYYKFESADDGAENYDSSTTYQFQVNNKLVPTWPANVFDAHVLTRAAFDQVAKTTGNANLPNDYRYGQFVFAQAFNFHAGEDEKLISGLDTRGASSNMSFILNNTCIGRTNDATVVGPTDGASVWVWALTTSTLEISAGQNVTVIM